MSTHQQSKPRWANQSMAEESGRPGTCRSKVGCEAMEEPWTNKTVPVVFAGSPTNFSHKKSFTPPLLVQCSWALTAAVLVFDMVTSFMNGPFEEEEVREVCDEGWRPIASIEFQSSRFDDLFPFGDLRA